MPLGQVDLSGVGEDVFPGQLGGVGVLGVAVDDGGVPGDHRAVGGDQHLEAVGIDLLAIAQAVEVPDHAHFHLALLQGLDGRVGQRQAALAGNLGEEVQARLDVLLVATVGDGRRQHAVHRLGGGAHITDGHLVAALFQVGPGAGNVLDQLLVDDEGDGAGVGQHPVAVVVLGPVGNLLPGGGLVGLGHPLLYGNGAEGGTHVADVGGGVL